MAHPKPLPSTHTGPHSPHRGRTTPEHRYQAQPGAIATECPHDGAVSQPSDQREEKQESGFAASSFKRTFSTSFGQDPIEKISEIVATDNGFEASRQKESQLNLYKGVVDEIERICSALRSGHQQPNWKKETQTLAAFTKGDTVVRRVISDLWLRKAGKENFISIKTVTPNLDQSEIAKKGMLLLEAVIRAR